MSITSIRKKIYILILYKVFWNRCSVEYDSIKKPKATSNRFLGPGVTFVDFIDDLWFFCLLNPLEDLCDPIVFYPALGAVRCFRGVGFWVKASSDVHSNLLPGSGVKRGWILPHVLCHEHPALQQHRRQNPQPGGGQRSVFVSVYVSLSVSLCISISFSLPVCVQYIVSLLVYSVRRVKRL